MRQQLFEFALHTSKESPVQLDPPSVAEATRLMAAAIFAVALQTPEESDEESEGQQQPHG